jgi:hypothetical protein
MKKKNAVCRSRKYLIHYTDSQQTTACFKNYPHVKGTIDYIDEQYLTIYRL